MKIFSISASIVCIVFVFASVVAAQTDKTITAGSAGVLRIGMTVSEARKAMPNAMFERTSDGDGVALIGVKVGNKEIMSLYAGEEDSEKPINPLGIVEQIEVWDSSYKVAPGVGPGVLVHNASVIYGGIKEIIVTEIESREYADFNNGPKGITFRIDYSGIYKEGEVTTKEFKKGAKIMSVLIHGDGSEKNIGFFSDYTNLETACTTPAGQGEEGGHVSTYCDGPEGFRIHIYDTAKSTEVTVASTESRNVISVMRENLSFSTKGKMMEWRFKNGVPFAVIMRGNKYEKGDDGLIKYPAKATGEYLFVRGLPGFESINADVNVATTRVANEEARKIADEGYVSVMFPSKSGFTNVDTSDRNLLIITAANKGESWVKSPMQVALRITGEFDEMATREMKFEAATPESTNAITLTVINDGLLDDSVRGEKWIYELVKETNGVWKVSSIKRAWKCWPGRGHEDFSSESCS